MTNGKSYKQRTYLDPIYGPIQLNLNDPTESLLAKIIDTKEFQRLRRIRQMGLAWFTFHGAEHTRFSHSLGTLFTARKMIRHLSNNFSEIDAFKTEILVSSLIHDIGHGPFSHTAEKLTSLTHEDWAKKIIVGDTEINSLLKTYNKDLPEVVVKTLEYKSSPIYTSQITASYVDADRLDYLHRDSYYVGVPYGLISSDRIISSLEIDTNNMRLVVKENIGLDAVIHYLQARHSMYQQIYQHKKNLACDFLLKKITQMTKESKPKNTSQILIDYLDERINIDSYLQVDDFLLISNIQGWANDSSTNKTLNDLSNRFISRKLFKSLEFRQEVQESKQAEVLEKARTIAQAKNLDPDYYVGIEKSASKPYEPYQASTNKISKAIFIRQQNGLIQELSEVSGIVKALSKENVVKTCLVFAAELEDGIKNTKGIHELFK